MNRIHPLKSFAIILCASLAIGCSSTNPSNAPQVSEDGLNLKLSTRSTIAYKKSGVDFSTYNQVQIMPSTVAFKQNWMRNYNRSTASISTRVKDSDVIRIKQSMATMLDEIFIEEFNKGTGYSVVSEPSANTLLIKPSIIDLDVNAPDLSTASRTRTYTQDSGEATLFLEIYDSVSGEILARVIDAQGGRDNGFYQWSTRVSNRADARRIIRGWAQKLRTKFDEAHTK
ncbi:DUF3313 family protein [Litorilituus lipolyticus]|uniref:DUF3313 domain-containing protein n=1 Tax=Litorilituus lipolyticus TaxID=2491017 RepID=A0A502KP05_9GAMM|nr:DUF3313 family protein [Litorilituus lipolyticus]TPH13480.1 DUF3313 domain-containing protein [Litorilituus lipolyticus]